MARRRPPLAELAPSPSGLAVDVIDDGEFAVLSWPIEGLAVDRLSRAEREVLAQVLRGASNAEIARARGSAVRTVANQVAAVLHKLGVASRFDLIRRFGDGARGAKT